MTALATLISFAATAVTWLMIIYVVMSWLLNFNVLNIQNPAVSQIWEGVSRLSNMLCDPIRRLMPGLGGLDLAPMLVIILAIVLERFLIIDVLGVSALG